MRFNNTSNNLLSYNLINSVLYMLLAFIDSELTGYNIYWIFFMLPVYFVISLVYNYLSLFFLSFSMSNIRKLLYIQCYIKNLRSNKVICIHYLWVSIFEEIVFRFIPLFLIITFLNHKFYIFFFTNFIFTILHFYNSKTIKIWKVVEFYLFFLVLSYFFYRYESILLIIIMHWIRNINIMYLKSVKHILITDEII